ncbi:FAM72 protein-domain-containing protein, partial [Entophlyctis helioformis]
MAQNIHCRVVESVRSLQIAQCVSWNTQQATSACPMRIVESSMPTTSTSTATTASNRDTVTASASDVPGQLSHSITIASRETGTHQIRDSNSRQQTNHRNARVAAGASTNTRAQARSAAGTSTAATNTSIPVSHMAGSLESSVRASGATSSQRPLQLQHASASHSHSTTSTPTTQRFGSSSGFPFSSAGSMLQSLFHPQFSQFTGQALPPHMQSPAYNRSAGAANHAGASAAATLPSGAATTRGQAPIRSQFRSKTVCEISCRHCNVIVCKRGMKAILLADTNVELFSTDSPPFGVQLVLEDYVTRNCQCRIRDVACLGCGNVVGYHVTQPCGSCLEACNNGHFWMF